MGTEINKLHAIEVFLAISKHGSLTRAANHLDCSLPTIVRTLAQLEREIGVQLFTRTTRSVSLTEEGEVYLDHCSRMIEDLQYLENQLGGGADHPSGIVNITAPVVFGEMHLTPVLSALLEEFENLQVRLVYTNRPVDLTEERIDVAVRIGHLQDSSLYAREVGSLRLVLVGSPQLIRRVGAPLCPADLETLPCLQYNGNSGGSLWKFERNNESVTARTTGRIVSDNVRSLVQACVDGLGYSLFFEYQVAEPIRQKQLKVLLPEWESEEIPVHLVYPNARLLSTRVNTVLHYLEKGLKKRFAVIKIRS